jgi:hypothetical protein
MDFCPSGKGSVFLSLKMSEVEIKVFGPGVKKILFSNSNDLLHYLFDLS